MKLKSFITSIITFLISAIVACFMLYVNIDINSLFIENSIGAGFSMIIYIPLMIILSIIAIGTNVTCGISSTKGISSENRTIKIMSIVFLILAILLLFLNIYNIMEFINIL